MRKLFGAAGMVAALVLAPVAAAHTLSMPRTVKVSSVLVKSYARDHYVFTEDDRAYPLYARWVVRRECARRGAGHARMHKARCGGWWIYEDRHSEAAALCRVFVDTRLRKRKNLATAVLKRKTARCWDVTDVVTGGASASGVAEADALALRRGPGLALSVRPGAR